MYAHRLTYLNPRIFTVGLLILAISLAPRIPLPFYIPGRVLDLRLEDIIIFFTLLFLTLNFLIRGQLKTNAFSVPLITPISIYLTVTIFTTIITLFLQEIHLAYQQNLLRIFFYNLKEIEFFIIFLIVVNFVRSELELKKIYEMILLTGIVNICWVAYQVLTNHHGPLFEMALPELAYQKTSRFMIYFVATIGEFSPFSVAVYFAIISFLFYACSFFMHPKSSIRQHLCFGAGIISTICSMFTWEKISVVFLVIGITTLFFLHKKKIKGLVIIFILIVLFVGTSQYVIRKTGSHFRIFHKQAYLGGITGSRITQWKELLPCAFDNIFLGIGKGSQYVYPGGSLGEEAHNHYLKLLLETGIFGLLTFLWLLFQINILCRRTFKKASLPITKVISSTTLCTFIGLSIASFVQDAFKPVLPNALFWCFVGLTAAAYRIERNTSKQYHKQ